MREKSGAKALLAAEVLRHLVVFDLMRDHMDGTSLPRFSR